MRPVNLLPDEYRSRSAGARSGSAYAVLGMLATLLAMVTLYVVTANQVDARSDAAAEAEAETAELRAEIAALGSFGDFSTIKQTREATVAAIAASRFDWERFVRELALVLPDGTWLQDVEAGTSQEDAGTEEASVAIAGPYAQLSGCAKRQPDVATLLVRLRRMHAVQDVTLAKSARAGESGGTGASCGRLYAFDVTVAFDPAVAVATNGPVPASLGGGR